VFDTAAEAWAYLADERRRGEEDVPATEGEPFSVTVDALDSLGTERHWSRHCGGSACTRPDNDHMTSLAGWLTERGIARDGTGSIWGETPGYDGVHDLGLAYTVSIVEEETE
jgi:hypothetical protein